MSLIRNLIDEPEDRPRKKKGNRSDEDESKDGPEKKQRPIIKSATDLQRLRLQKLMMNPDKPIVIPESQREKDYMQTVPTFVRNVMGSSAGAGSGEFHVYRHLRRKEYARQKTIQAKSIREQMDDEYKQKLEDNKRKAEEKTAKKRAKRLNRKRNRAKKPRSDSKDTTNEVKNDEATSDDDDEVKETITEGSERPQESSEITAAGHTLEQVVNEGEKTKQVETLDQTELEKVEPKNDGVDSEKAGDPEKSDQTELEKLEPENVNKGNESENIEHPEKLGQTELEKVEPENLSEGHESVSIESVPQEPIESVDTSNTEKIKENTNTNQSSSEGLKMETNPPTDPDDAVNTSTYMNKTN